MHTTSSFFFFSSRRRHTRCLSDWSSDVCSSDLPLLPRPDKCAKSAQWRHRQDRKSTRLNSSHLGISYAVFCLKKKKQYTHSYDGERAMSAEILYVSFHTLT